jgi:hypothetical protein
MFIIASQRHRPLPATRATAEAPICDRPATEKENHMNMQLELVLIPVSDPGRAKKFYLERLGLDLLMDRRDGLPGQRVIQVTPPGSACSVGFSTGITIAPPGSKPGLLLVVPDVIAARDELIERGVDVGEVRRIVDGARSPSSPIPTEASRLLQEATGQGTGSDRPRVGWPFPVTDDGLCGRPGGCG